MRRCSQIGRLCNLLFPLLEAIFQHSTSTMMLISASLGKPGGWLTLVSCLKRWVEMTLWTVCFLLFFLRSTEVPAASVLPAACVPLQKGGLRLLTREQMVGRWMAPKVLSLLSGTDTVYSFFFFLLSPSCQLEANLSLSCTSPAPESVMKI